MGGHSFISTDNCIIGYAVVGDDAVARDSIYMWRKEWQRQFGCMRFEMSVLHAKRHIIIIGNIVSCILNNNRWAWMCCVIKHIQSMIAIEAIALAIRNYTLFIHFVQLFPLLFLAILLAFSSCSSLNSITTMQAHAGDVSRVSCSLHVDRDKKQCDSHVAVRFTSIRTFKSITITKHSM